MAQPPMVIKLLKHAIRENEFSMNSEPSTNFAHLLLARLFARAPSFVIVIMVARSPTASV